MDSEEREISHKEIIKEIKSKFGIAPCYFKDDIQSAMLIKLNIVKRLKEIKK